MLFLFAGARQDSLSAVFQSTRDHQCQEYCRYPQQCPPGLSWKPNGQSLSLSSHKAFKSGGWASWHLWSITKSEVIDRQSLLTTRMWWHALLAFRKHQVYGLGQTAAEEMLLFVAARCTDHIGGAPLGVQCLWHGTQNSHLWEAGGIAGFSAIWRHANSRSGKHCWLKVEPIHKHSLSASPI